MEKKYIRIKKDVFKNAEFGKPYKTREGRKAVFLKYMDIGCLLLIQRDFGFQPIKVSDKGKHYLDKDWDIVSEWEDENPKEGLVSIEKAAEWVKNSFKGTFGEGLAENIKQEFIETMTK